MLFILLARRNSRESWSSAGEVRAEGCSPSTAGGTPAATRAEGLSGAGLFPGNEQLQALVLARAGRKIVTGLEVGEEAFFFEHFGVARSERVAAHELDAAEVFGRAALHHFGHAHQLAEPVRKPVGEFE